MTTQHAHFDSLRLAMLAGMTGAGLALLFAPRSGHETREKIRLAAHNMKDHTEQKVEHARAVKDRAQQAMTEGKRSAKEKYHELRENSVSSDTDESMPSDLRTINEEEV